MQRAETLFYKLMAALIRKQLEPASQQELRHWLQAVLSLKGQEVTLKILPRCGMRRQVRQLNNFYEN